MEKRAPVHHPVQVVMRARGQLTEIRAHDLRFTPEVAAQFFNQSMHLALIALSPHDSSPEALAAFESAFAGLYRPLTVGEPVQFP